MIGHTSAGKTTYMAALYHKMHKGLHNYKVRYDTWNNYLYQHYDLRNRNYTYEEAEKEGKNLEQLAKNVSKGIYPSPTAIKQEYVFKMQYKDFEEVDFNWYDYRGGALMEKTSQSQETLDLISKISKSDALIVFLDGPLLEEPIINSERYLRRLIYLVKSAMSKISVKKEHFPISFVLTKNDMCVGNVLDSPGYQYLYSEILQDIETNTKFSGLITWVAINDYQIYNVEWPLLFSISACMPKFIEEVQAAYWRRENNRGFFDSIHEFFTDEDWNTTNRIVNQMKESLKDLTNILQKWNKKSLRLI